MGEILKAKPQQAHPDKDKFKRLLNWLFQGGAVIPKVSMCFYTQQYRGVQTTSLIQANQCILYVPLSHIITLQMAHCTLIGTKLQAANTALLSPKHCYLSVFLYQELQKVQSFWIPYLQVLPKTFSNFPIFYQLYQRRLLQGTAFLKQVDEKISDITQDYRMICQVAPQFQEFSLQQFFKLRMVVSSRIFGMQINNTQTDGFVPFADMFNHKRPRQTSWFFDQQKNGFVVYALQDISRGQQVLDSYGRKCNSRFLLNYGFIVKNNDGDEFPFKIKFNSADPLYLEKRVLIEARSYKIRVQADDDGQSFWELLGTLRIMYLEDSAQILGLIQSQNSQSESFSVGKIGMFSIEVQERVLRHIREYTMKRLNKYPTTVVEDQEILGGELTENQRNCVLMRKGEKEILMWYKEFTDQCWPLFQYTQKEVQEAAESSKYAGYINECVLPWVHK